MSASTPVSTPAPTSAAASSGSASVYQATGDRQAAFSSCMIGGVYVQLVPVPKFVFPADMRKDAEQLCVALSQLETAMTMVSGKDMSWVKDMVTVLPEHTRLVSDAHKIEFNDTPFPTDAVANALGHLRLMTQADGHMSLGFDIDTHLTAHAGVLREMLEYHGMELKTFQRALRDFVTGKARSWLLQGPSPSGKSTFSVFLRDVLCPISGSGAAKYFHDVKPSDVEHCTRQLGPATCVFIPDVTDQESAYAIMQRVASPVIMSLLDGKRNEEHVFDITFQLKAIEKPDASFPPKTWNRRTMSELLLYVALMDVDVAGAPFRAV